jgi:hypothetical protein
MIEVSQSARKTASEIVRRGAPGLGNGNKVIAGEIKYGLHDDYFIVQAIAEAEQRGMGRAAVIADQQAEFHALEVYIFNVKGQIESSDSANIRAEKCRNIAQAIRTGAKP